MTTTRYTATASNGATDTRNSKATYTHARAYSFPDGETVFTFHKSEKAAATGAHPHPSWSNLPREIVTLTVA